MLILTALCFAVSFGLNCGSSNHAQYLLQSVRLLDPELWPRDWLVNTRQYHLAFEPLGALLLWLDGSGWLMALANVVAIGAGLWCVHRLLHALCEPRAAGTAFFVVLTIGAASRTHGVGGSYVFADIFQPSTLGSLGLLGAAAAFVHGRWLLAGFSLAFAGAFHLNVLLLGLCVVGAAWLFDRGEGMLRRGVLLLAPAGAVLLYFVPFLLASTASELAAEAQWIYQEVRAPHHYKVATFAAQFLPWVAFQLLGLAALWPRASTSTPAGRRLLFLLAGFWLLIVPASVLAGVVQLRSVAQLFPWRISAHADLLAQTAFAAAFVAALQHPTRALAELGRGQRIVIGAATLLLVLSALLGLASAAAILVLLLLVSFVLLARYTKRSSAQPLASWHPRVDACFVVAFLAVSVPAFARTYSHSDLLAGRDDDLAGLCAWVKATTAKDALLLTPPDEEEIRLRCERAIVVDWKGFPALPEDILEWRKRLEDVTGHSPVLVSREVRLYASMDADRLNRLHEKYGFDVLVLRRESELRLAGAPDYEHGRFLAYRMAPRGGAAPPSLAGSANLP